MKKFWNDTFHLNSVTNTEKSIIGTLNPIKWNHDGSIKTFSIYSDEDEDIIIEGFRNRKKLNKLLNKRVLAKGLMRITESGEKYIKLKSIKELTGPTSPAVRLVNPLRPSFLSEEYSLSIPKEYALNQYNQFHESYWEAC